MDALNLDIITPDATVYSGKVESVTVPGSEGRFQVLKNHAPIISTLTEGPLKFKTMDQEEHLFRASGGVVEVLKNKVIVLVESIQRVEAN
ncbi:MAG: ATP synthase F1 subunit epsilon [Bacteroidota bacterium]